MVKLKELDSFPVLLTFDLDGEFPFSYSHPGDPYWITQGHYGPNVGVYRILDLLKQEDLKSTFCVVGKVAEKYPEAVEKIMEAGHELAVHGYSHTPYFKLSMEEERNEITKTREILEKISGIKPVGHRTPWWGPSKNTPQILREEEFVWSSDHMGSEKPFLHEIDSEKSRLLEIPVSYILDDWPFYYDWGSPCRIVLETWLEEFTARYNDASVFCLTMHPLITGRPSRLKILKKLVERIKKQPKIEFMRMNDYYERVI
jgi:peptidoglycan/xylan/chitin deacetylase (PgdA/CDA1 family)